MRDESCSRSGQIGPVVSRLFIWSLPPLTPPPLTSVYRLRYLILHSREAAGRRREGQHLLWSGGVCAVHSQMFSAFHHLQQSPLRLPEALEVWQPEVICKGIRSFYWKASLCRTTGAEEGVWFVPCVQHESRPSSLKSNPCRRADSPPTILQLRYFSFL